MPSDQVFYNMPILGEIRVDFKDFEDSVEQLCFVRQIRNYDTILRDHIEQKIKRSNL